MPLEIKVASDSGGTSILLPAEIAVKAAVSGTPTDGQVLTWDAATQTMKWMTPGGGGLSAIEYFDDAEFTWAAGARTIVHNKGRHPDLVTVSVKKGTTWTTHYDYAFQGVSYGWHMVNSSQTLNQTVITLFSDQDGGTPLTRVRLWFFSPAGKDVTSRPAGGGAGTL
jgi:hypothetical protein